MHISRAMCPAKNAVCHGCGKQGHYVKVCRKIKSNTAAAYSLSEFDHNPETEWEQPRLASILATAPECLSHALIKAKMKGKEVDVLIDSGVSGNFIDSKVAAELKITMHGEGSEISMASQELLAKTHGSLKTAILVLNRSYLLNFEVIDKLCTDVILGQDFLRKHSEVTFCMGGSDPPLKINDNQLNVAVAKVEAPRLFEFFSPDCKPVASPSGVYCKEDQDFIKTEVKRLLKEDIIETSRSPWRVQVLVVKRGEKQRLVIDYSSTINRFTILDAYPLPRIDSLVNQIANDRFYSSIDLRAAYHQVPLQESKNLHQF